MPIKLPLLSALAVAISAPALADDTVLGRWCDHPIPNMATMDNVITLSRMSGRPTGRQEFRTSSLDLELVETTENVFQQVDSRDGFRIAADGNLELFDEEGPIRTATRLGSAAGLEDCLR